MRYKHLDQSGRDRLEALLKAVRRKCLAGYKLVYFSVIRVSDSWVVIEDAVAASNRLPSIIKMLKGRVDHYYRMLKGRVDHYYRSRTKGLVEKLNKAPQIRKKLQELLDKVSDTCEACKGSGGKPSNPCKACGGSGKVRPKPLT